MKIINSPNHITRTLEGIQDIYIGNYTPVNGLGDAIILTAVIRELNIKYPTARLHVLTCGPGEIFNNNYRISSLEHGYVACEIEDWPAAEHQVTHKLRLYDIKPNSLRGEIFFTNEEIAVAQKALRTDKPAILVCNNGASPKQNISMETLDYIIKGLSLTFNVYQIESKAYQRPMGEGIKINSTIHSALQDLRPLPLRIKLALLSLVKRYVGIDTGFMHAAHCFGNSFVYINKNLDSHATWVYDEDTKFYSDTNKDKLIAQITDKWAKNEQG